MALSHIIKSILPSTFQIQLHIPNEMPFIIGTGFAISADGYIITANHVATALQEPSVPAGAKLLAGLAAPNFEQGWMRIQATFMVFDCKVIASNEGDDLALLKISRPWDEIKAQNLVNGTAMITQATPCKFEFARPQEGESVAISGFPLAEPSMITTTGVIANSWAGRGFEDRYLADVTANPGNSGGPVYLAKSGKVIGVCVAGKLTNVLDAKGNDAKLKHSAGLTYVVPSRAIKNLLEAENINTTLI